MGVGSNSACAAFHTFKNVSWIGSRIYVCTYRDIRNCFKKGISNSVFQIVPGNIKPPVSYFGGKPIDEREGGQDGKILSGAMMVHFPCQIG